MAYWYNVRTGQVEQDGATSRKDDLMGPYDTEADAQQALQTAAEKTKQWDEQEEAEKEA